MKLASKSAFRVLIEFEPIEFGDLLRIVQTARAEYGRLDREVIGVPQDRVARLAETMERASMSANPIKLELARLQFGDLLDVAKAVNTESEFLDPSILTISGERVSAVTDRLYDLIGEEPGADPRV